MAQNKNQNRPVWRILARVGQQFLDKPPEEPIEKASGFFKNVQAFNFFREIVKTP